MVFNDVNHVAILTNDTERLEAGYRDVFDAGLARRDRGRRRLVTSRTISTVIVSCFQAPSEYQFRVRFWGIFGALTLRAAFIFAGVALIEHFEWFLYMFGILLYMAVKIARHDEAVPVDYERNVAMRMVRKVVPTTPEYDDHRLFTTRNARRVATPLFTLILIAVTDVVFAVDSVPAILAVSREPFLVFASNAFAILGLRSLYFLVGGRQGKFRYLNIGLGAILAFVGIKMLIGGKPLDVHVPTVVSSVFIAAVLALAIVTSLRADACDADKFEENLGNRDRADV